MLSTGTANPNGQMGFAFFNVVERRKLSELRGKADKIIDTSRLKASELRSELRSQWSECSDALSVSIITFGYKHGIPISSKNKSPRISITKAILFTLPDDCRHNSANFGISGAGKLSTQK